jgi:hypothetical protein
MRRFDTPVAIVLFNRPSRVAALVECLRVAQPRQVFAIADGPRPNHPGDRERCEQSRAALAAIDWPCEIVREFAASNLGCDERIEQGLDWLFERVDRAIVLEDDIRPTPRFLPWAASMLDLYGDDSTFSIASGHNSLGVWGDHDSDHVRARRGSIWGWATTARFWRECRTIPLTSLSPGDQGRWGTPALDPLLAEHCQFVVAEARKVSRVAWDTSFSVRMFATGRFAAVSSVNLITNTGIGADATRTTFADDFVASLPALDRAFRGTDRPPGIDPAFDRASLLAELVGRCVRPDLALRLARLLRATPGAPLDAATRLHLAPFLHADETLAILDHLSDHGATGDHFDRVRAALRRLTGRSRA